MRRTVLISIIFLAFLYLVRSYENIISPRGLISELDAVNENRNKDYWQNVDQYKSERERLDNYQLYNNKQEDNIFMKHKPIEIDKSGDLIELSDEFFLSQINDIYFNTSEYLGKKIVYEGIYLKGSLGADNKIYHCVFRYGPGCCANDGYVGFEVLFDGKYPKNYSWVKVEGILEEYKENGTEYLFLRLDNIVEIEKRGQETVFR